MESFAVDTQSPPQAGAEATEGSLSGVAHPGSQTGAEAVHDSVFRLRHPGSGLIPGRIPGGRPPLRHPDRLVPAVAVGSSAVRAKPKNTKSTNQSQKAQELAMSAPAYADKPATDVAEAEGVNVPMHIFDEDEGQGGEEDEVVAIAPKRRKFISPVWMHFERLEIEGKWKARCVHCSKKLPANTKNGTTHIIISGVVFI